MMDTWLILNVLAAHYLSDYVLQPHKVASTKGKDWMALGAHISQYTGCMWLLTLPSGVPEWWVLLAGGLHFLTDVWTARLGSHFYAEERVKAFWCVIGLDQLIHVAALLLTLPG